MTWLTTRVALYACAALAAVCVGLGVWIWIQGAALTVCESRLEAAGVTIESQKKSIIGHQETIRAQNQSIERLMAEDEKRRTAAAEAVAKAQAEKAKAEGRRQQLERLLAAPTPSGAQCKEAIGIVRKGLQP